MGKRIRRPTWKKGYRGELMRLFLTVGVISRRGIPLLHGNHRMYLRKIREMEKEQIIEKHRNNGNVVENLKDFEKRVDEYIGDYSNGYYGFFNRYCQTNIDYVTKYGKDRLQFERAVRDSESTIMAHSAGAKVFIEDKTDLRSEENIAEDSVVYYRTSEIKGSRKTGNGEKIIAQTRCNGWLSSPGGDYLLYMIGKKLIRWTKISETSFAGYVTLLAEKKKKGEKREVKESILLAYTDEPYRRMTSIDSRQISVNLNVENGHSVMYGLLYNTIGRDMMQIMTKKNWKEEMKKEYLEGMNTNTGKSVVACDAIDGDVKILLFCIPDIVKLKKFLSAAALENDVTKYHVYCFDYQSEFITAVAGKYCEVYTTSFAEYYSEKIKG